MPGKKKTAYIARARTPETDDIGDSPAIEEDTVPYNNGSSKAKDVAPRDQSNDDYKDARVETNPMEQRRRPLSPTQPPSSVLGQLPQQLERDRRSGGIDALNDDDLSQKISDDHTPPFEQWSRLQSHSRIPTTDHHHGFFPGASPQYEPGFSSRRPSHVRSPPVSPPMRNARPVSYSSVAPPLPMPRRLSTSPYSYTGYASPPALPHLPQQHFYAAHDVDLGMQPPKVPLPEPFALKFTAIPGSTHEDAVAVLSTVDGEINVASCNGEKLEHLGALIGVNGTITDATLLTWSTGSDPLAAKRPLIALVVTCPGRHEPQSPQLSDAHYHAEPISIYEVKVVVYSLSQGCEIAELLHAPIRWDGLSGVVSDTGSDSGLKIQSSGNYIVVSSSESGEVFVFTLRQENECISFECLAKYWTTLQPNLQRRDSSVNASSADADVSPADIGRGIDVENAPIMSLAGRWLAFCPPATSSRNSIRATLGVHVIDRKGSNLSATTPPSKPATNCEVDSPDVETFLGRVAKGFAQEAVKGAKWIGEKGLQTWQNYWKREPSTPQPSFTTTVSPPIHPSQQYPSQFPPTHGFDQPNSSRDSDLVTIVDIRLLQETTSKKPLTASLTFQPPSGCSFLSFSPTGISLVTANRKGDVYYVWDLVEMRHRLILTAASAAHEIGRVRQIARYERVSPSTVVDLAWDGPVGYRFALLTKNQTIHLFDLPREALQWPPASTKKMRPTSAPVEPPALEPDAAPAGGFLASAMQLAGRTQPVLASMRGRAPSMSGGVPGLTPGFASTATIRSGGRAVAAGLSKSLGAASETVTSMRHANQSRLKLKTASRPGMICWLKRDGKPVVSLLDGTLVKNYHVRMTKPRDGRHMDTVSVFDARKAVAVKLPKAIDVPALLGETRHSTNAKADPAPSTQVRAFWKSRSNHDTGIKNAHPLASAEIDTNSPYQPFHADKRVIISVVKSDLPMFGSLMVQPMVEPPLPTTGGLPEQDLRIPTSSLAIHNFNRHMSTDTSKAQLPQSTIAGSSLATTPVDLIENDFAPVIAPSKKKKGKKTKSQARLVDEDDFFADHSEPPLPTGGELMDAEFS
jgi:hypothetical protein